MVPMVPMVLMVMVMSLVLPTVTALLHHQVSQNSFDRSEGSPMNPWVGDVFVSILPCWHIFERTAEYFTLTRGVTMVKPSLYDECARCTAGCSCLLAACCWRHA